MGYRLAGNHGRRVQLRTLHPADRSCFTVLGSYNTCVKFMHQVRTAYRQSAMRAVLRICLLVVWSMAVGAQAQIADLSLAKSGPSSALNGETVTYSLTISSVGPNGANGATFVDTLPSGLSNVSATCTLAINGAACPASLTVSATSVSGSIPTFPANGGVTMIITARLPVGGTDTSLTNNASVSTPSGVTDPNPSSNNSFINTALTYRTADLRVTKLASSTSYVLGSPIDYTVTLTNLGPGPADGATLRDRLSATTVGLGTGGAITSTVNSVVCIASGGAQCPSFTPPASVTTNNNVFSNAIPLLPSGGQIELRIRITPTGYAVGTCGFTQVNLSNLGDITGMPASVVDPVSGNNSQTQVSAGPTGVIPACPQADIGTTKSVTPTATLTFGQPVTYTLVFFNNGPGDASGTRINDAIILNLGGTGLQPVLGYTAASVLSCVSTSGTVCPSFSVPAFGTLTNVSSSIFNQTVTAWPSGGRLTISYALTPQNFGTQTCGYTTFQLRNVTGNTLPTGYTDPGPSANTAAVNSNLPLRPACAQTDIAASKSLISGNLGLGQTLTYLITVSNIGATTATNVAFVDTINHSSLGTGVGNPYLTINNISRGNCTSTGATSCPTFPSLPPALALNTTLQNLIPNTTITSMGPSSSISFTVSFVQSVMDASCARVNAVLDNRLTLIAPTTYIDTAAANNAATVTSTFSCADVSTVKTVQPTTVPAGSTLTFTFDVTNVGPATLSNVPFTDPLPAGFSHLSSNCTVLSGGASCGATLFTPSPAQVDGTITSLPPGSVVRYTIAGLAANLPGSWNNRGSVQIPLPGLFDPDLQSNASAVSFNVTSDLPSVSKFTTRANSSPNGTTAYTIVVSNPTNGLPVTNMRITDLLPTGWTYVSTTAVTLNPGSTRPTLLTPTLGDSTPTWGLFNLGTATSVVISFVAAIPPSQTCGQVVSNVVNAVYTRGGGTQTSSYLGLDAGLTSDDVAIRCPQVGAAKVLLAQADNGDGSFSLQYSIRFRNTGDETLSPLQVRDPLASAQGGAFGVLTANNPPGPSEYRIATAPVFVGPCAGMALAGGYNGGSQQNLATGSLVVGQECEIRFSIQMGPTATLSIYNNQSDVRGTGSASLIAANDLSDDGTDPLPGSTNGFGTSNDPTPALISPSAQLSISKTNGVTELIAGQTISYIVEVDNAGPSGVLQATLRDVPSAGLVCTNASCTVLIGTATCPAVGVALGELSIANLNSAGVLIPRINAGARLQFVIDCDVTATGQ
jgi:uncharacterized repeat protein (TIGR01451 family)